MDSETRTSIVTGFEYNTDHEERDQIMELYMKGEYFGNLAHFEDLPFQVLEKLLDQGFADPAGKQNDAPTTQEFLEFMRVHPILTAHGYIVHINRTDYRVTVEGLVTPSNTTGPWDQSLPEAFAEFSRGSSELRIDNRQLRSWYD